MHVYIICITYKQLEDEGKVCFKPYLYISYIYKYGLLRDIYYYNCPFLDCFYLYI